jgi:hypothetical protein
LPWIRHRFKNEEGRWEYHSLALDEFDEWERVAAVEGGAEKGT